MKTNKNISKYLFHVIVSKLSKYKCLFKHFEVEQNIYRLLSYSKGTSNLLKVYKFTHLTTRLLYYMKG